MSEARIMYRLRTVVNTDPERRCYYGVNFSEEVRWTNWSELERVAAERAEARLTFWRELNDYAVSERGQSAKREFKLEL